MSQLELIAELRAARLAASPELRERVAAIAGRPPAASRFRLPAFSLPPRRLTLGLVGVAVLAAGGAALVGGLSGSLSEGKQSAAPVATQPAWDAATSSGRRTLQPNHLGADVSPAPKTLEAQAPAVPPSTDRTQRYEAELRLRVADLSAGTKTALRLTRGYGGYVRSVEYGSGSQSGTALFVLRVPVTAVQRAVVRFSDLGTILSQHVRIQDLQPGVDKRFQRLQAIRREITKLQAQPQSEERDAEIARYQAELVALQKEQAAVRKQASYATVSLGLTTKRPAVAPPPPPGRINRALHHAGSILVKEVVVLLYVGIVGGPLIALALLGLAGERGRRRRATERLLAG